MPINPIGAPSYEVMPTTIINIFPPELINLIFGGSDTDVQVNSTSSIVLGGNGTTATPIEALLRVSNNPTNKLVVVPIPNAGAGVYVAPANWSEITGNPTSNTNLIDLLTDYNDELRLLVEAVDEKVGKLDNLTTVNRSNTVGAINELNAKISGIQGDNIAVKLTKTRWFTLY